MIIELYFWKRVSWKVWKTFANRKTTFDYNFFRVCEQQLRVLVDEKRPPVECAHIRDILDTRTDLAGDQSRFRRKWKPWRVQNWFLGILSVIAWWLRCWFASDRLKIRSRSIWSEYCATGNHLCDINMSIVQLCMAYVMRSDRSQKPVKIW